MAERLDLVVGDREARTRASGSASSAVSPSRETCIATAPAAAGDLLALRRRSCAARLCARVRCEAVSADAPGRRCRRSRETPARSPGRRRGSACSATRRSGRARAVRDRRSRARPAPPGRPGPAPARCADGSVTPGRQHLPDRSPAARTAPARRRGHSRPRSIRSPSSASIAGSTVSDPTTAIATTTIAPSAIEVNTPKPVNSSPASPITTVMPATRIARPTVAEVAASAASADAPDAAFDSLAADVEQRVVDADREADQDHDRGRRGAVGRDV